MPTNNPNSIVGDCLSGFATLLKLRGGGYSATLLKIKGQIDLPLVVRKLGTESAGSYLKQWPHKMDIRKTVRQVVIDYPILKGLCLCLQAKLPLALNGAGDSMVQGLLGRSRVNGLRLVLGLERTSDLEPRNSPSQQIHHSLTL